MITTIRKRVYYAFLISLLVHLAFMIWSIFVKFINAPPGKPENVMQVRISRDKPGPEAPRSKVNETLKSLAPENPLAQMQAWQPPAQSTQTVKDNVAAAVQRKSEPLAPSSASQIQNFEEPRAQGMNSTKKVRRATRKNLVEVGAIPKQDFTSGAPEMDSGKDLSKDYMDRTSAGSRVLPVIPAAATASGQDELQEMKKSSSGLSKKVRTIDLGTALTFELSKYEDAKTGEKYFKLLVKVRDATMDFPVIPKEIIFLLDSSGSIGLKRLEQFAEGVIYSLGHLNSHDRFNILVFKDKTIPFSEKSLAVEQGNIKQAVKFLRTLKSGSTTDVYNALHTSLDVKSDFAPSYRVLISDGYPTRGIVDSRQLINETSRINDGRVSIFTFGGGSGISKYMLDFVAYKNRGWSEFEDREYLIGREFSKFYDKVKDPLLLNLRYHISGVDANQVFPQTEPDFFKGSEFVVYGTYDKEGKIFLQVLGNSMAGIKEFIVNADLKKASAATKDIARQWAFHKVYFLIGQLKSNEPNADLIREIDNLCGKFDIVTPYSKNFRQDERRIKEAPKAEAPPAPQEPQVQPNSPPAAAQKNKQNFGPRKGK